MKKWTKWTGLMLFALYLFQTNFLFTRAEDYWPDGLEIQAEAAVVMEASTGTVLYEKNPHEKLYPASITKILTSLLVLENCSLDEEVTFSYESVHNIDRESTHISRDVNEVMTMEQCLYAVLLGSANDCAYAVAEHAGGSFEKFSSMMNERAKALGCTDSNFTNPHGLTDENHYTSAKDMALISREAIKDETFRIITGTKKYTIPKTNKHPLEETPLVNHHKMLAPYKGDKSYLYEYCIGGKPGYTDAASNTLVTYAEKDDIILICVIMKADSVSQYTDTRALLDYCYENFQLLNVSENEKRYIAEGTADLEIFENSEKFVDLDKEARIVLPKAASFEEASSTINLERVSEDVVGTLDYTYANRVVGKADIKVTGAKVRQFPFQTQEQIQNEQKKNNIIKIDVKKILKSFLLLILIVGIGIGIFYLVNNFYLIRYKLTFRHSRKKRYKTIKPPSHIKKKKRR